MPDFRDRGLGWLKDPPDYRDHTYIPKITQWAYPTPPDVVDLRKQMPRIRDQGSLGSCAPHTANTCAEFTELHDLDPDHDQLSVLWTYYYARQKIGTVGEDSGSHIRDCFKVLAERGSPRNRYWPYDISRFREQPSAGERSAPHHRTLEYKAIQEGNEDAMRICLGEGYPFAFGFAVYESFWRIGADGQWSGERGRIDGYHAVVAVGYTEKHWIIRNSWGIEFGDRGHFYVPRGWMNNEAYDCWTVRKVTVDP